jgi:hypothetical protein
MVVCCGWSLDNIYLAWDVSVLAGDLLIVAGGKYPDKYGVVIDAIDGPASLAQGIWFHVSLYNWMSRWTRIFNLTASLMIMDLN